MLTFIYIVMALVATIAGSITGMGGGVVMKPIMDLLGNYNAATIGVLSSVTVLAMSIVACIRQVKSKGQVKLLNLLWLGISSAAGGVAGQFLFDAISKSVASDAVVKIIQNGVLCALIVVIFFYMLFQKKIPLLKLSNPIFFVFTGIFLGVASSFLGIGGGPINVAILMFLFSMDIKSATFASIVTILFAQVSKLIMVGATTSFFSGMELSVLPFMAIAAVVGAFIGSIIKKKISANSVVICFNLMQIVVMGICIYNIISLTIVAF